MIKYFKDIPINGVFSFKDNLYKKIDILTAKDVRTQEFKDFYLMDRG